MVISIERILIGLLNHYTLGAPVPLEEFSRAILIHNEARIIATLEKKLRAVVIPDYDSERVSLRNFLTPLLIPNRPQEIARLSGKLATLLIHNEAKELLTLRDLPTPILFPIHRKKIAPLRKSLIPLLSLLTIERNSDVAGKANSASISRV